MSLFILLLLDIVVPELYLAYLQSVLELVHPRLQAIVTNLPETDLMDSVQIECS